MLPFAAVMFAPEACSPRWTPGSLTLLQTIDLRTGTSKVVTERETLDQVAASLAQATVVSPSIHAWTLRVKIEPDRGLWLYDARSGDFAALSITQRPTYRIDPADKTRFDEILGVTPTAPPTTSGLP